MQCSAGNLPGNHASWIMMRAENRTENPSFCSLNQHWVTPPQTKSRAWWHPRSHSLAPLQAQLPLCRRSHRSAQARQEMQTGEASAQHQAPIWGGQAPRLLWRGLVCICHLRDQAPWLRTSGVMLCSVGTRDGGDWCEQPGPTYGGEQNSSPSCLAWFIFWWWERAGSKI